MEEEILNNQLGQLYVVGTRGYSAYEVAVQNGFEGTEEEWLTSLIGPQGPTGPDGRSAYQVAVDNGYIGTEEEWVNSFLTPDGYYNKYEVNDLMDGKVNTSDIIDNLTTNDNKKVLSAKQGRTLKTLIDTNTSDISNNSTRILNEITARDNADDALQTQINALASGSPLVATDVSEMIDTTRTYVNTTDGEWYYYDGNDWVSGGTYQAAEDSPTVDDLVALGSKFTSIGEFTLVEGEYYKVETNEFKTHTDWNYIKMPLIPTGTYIYKPDRNESRQGYGIFDKEGNVLDSGLATKADITISLQSLDGIASYGIFTYRPTDLTADKLVEYVGSIHDGYVENDRKLNLEINSFSKITTFEEVEGVYYKSTTNEFKNNASYNYIKIPIVENSTYLYLPNKEETVSGYGIFDVNGNVLDSDVATAEGILINTSNYLTEPSYGIFSYRPVDTNSSVLVQFKGSIYDCFYESNKRMENMYNIPKLVLPTHSVATIGHEWNMYFDNVIENFNDDYYIDIELGVGLNKSHFNFLSDCLRYTPSTVCSGNVTVKIIHKKTNAILETKTFELSTINDTVALNKYVVCIGDSLTDSDIWTAEVEYNLSKNKIHSVGTIRNEINDSRVSPNQLVVYNEGRAGWSSTDYAGSSSPSHPMITDERNAFNNNGVFDFTYYMNNVSKKTGLDVDVEMGLSLNAVIIGLGTNGSNYLTYMVEGLDRMISSIREYDANVPIIISLVSMPATQDGVGKNNNMQNAEILRQRLFNVNRKYLEKYEDNVDYPNVYLAEVYFNLDCKRDFNTVIETASQRNPMEVVRQNNNVHPSVYGYLKFADVYFANLVKHMN